MQKGDQKQKAGEGRRGIYRPARDWLRQRRVRRRWRRVRRRNRGSGVVDGGRLHRRNSLELETSSLASLVAIQP